MRVAAGLLQHAWLRSRTVRGEEAERRRGLFPERRVLVHIPTMLAVLGYLEVSHISIHFRSFIKLFLPSGFGVREVSRCSTLLLTAMVWVPGAFKPSCWFLYTQDWWWLYLKWLCRVGCVSGMTSPGSQKTLPTRPTSPSCCTLSQLGRDTRLRGTAIRTRNRRGKFPDGTWSSHPCHEQPRHSWAPGQPPVTACPPSLQHPPAEPLWEPLTPQPEPQSLNILGCREPFEAPLAGGDLTAHCLPNTTCLCNSRARGFWLALWVMSLHLYTGLCWRDPHWYCKYLCASYPHQSHHPTSATHQVLRDSQNHPGKDGQEANTITPAGI